MIEYKFPVVTFRGDGYDYADTSYYDASLEPVQCRFDPYEAKLTALKGTYDITLGYSSKSRFLCVPNKGFSCNAEAPCNILTGFLNYPDTGGYSYKVSHTIRNNIHF